MSLSARGIMNRLAKTSNVLKEVDGQERKKLQETLLSCMQDLHQKCNENGISYVLAGGSALGAARHAGFIPWDDDIDVLMPRKDWELFKSRFPTILGDKYELEGPNYGNKDTKNMWGKMYLKGTRMVEIQDVNMPFEKGVFIDIFIYDNVSHNKLTRMMDAKIIHFLNGVAGSQLLYRYPNVWLKQFYNATIASRFYYFARRTLGFLFSWISHQKLCNWTDRFQSRHKFSGIITVSAGRKGYLGEIMNASDVFPAKEISFEGKYFFVANHVELYLMKLYGRDYMQIPTKEKRERHFVYELDIP